MMVRRTPTFAFIVHPRDEQDFFRARCLTLLRDLSTDDQEFVCRACKCPPTVVGEIVFGFSPFRGALVSIGFLPKQVVTAKGRAEITRAVQMMVEQGVRVIGLGALTSSATDGGRSLIDELPRGVTLTNGNAYTAAVLRENVTSAAAMLSLDRPPRVGIVGSTGSVGSVLSALLAKDDVDLLLIGRTVRKVRELLGSVAPAARVSDCLGELITADVIVVLTNDPSAQLTPEVVRAGCIVIEAAEPPNISSDAERTWPGDIKILRGGRVRIPNYRCTYDFGLPDPTETYACLAETYLFARDGIREHSVGTPRVQLAERLARAAVRQGIRPSLFGADARRMMPVPASVSS